MPARAGVVPAASAGGRAWRAADDADRRHLRRRLARLDVLAGQIFRLTPAGSRDTDGDLAGPVEHVAEALSVYRAGGVSEFIVRDHRDDDVQATIDAMAAMDAEVLSAVR